jgi:hypothetical protein
LAHRVTLVSVIRTIMEQEEAKKTKEYVDYNKQIVMKISRTPEAVQEKLRSILLETHRMVTVYTAISSLLFMVAAVIFGALEALNVMNKIGKADISAAVEREAYRAECRRPLPQETALA